MPKFRLRPLAALVLLPLAAARAATPVPPDVQQRIIAKFADTLVLPETAIWRFDDFRPFEAGGNVACGHINYQDSTRAYIGWRPFYAVVRGSAIDSTGMVPRWAKQDAVGAVTGNYNTLCNDHYKLPG
jgi:hypothetical protein